MYIDIVAGTTADLNFQLLESGSPIDLSGATVELLLSDRNGDTVSAGTVSVVDATNGKVKLVPTSASVFTTTLGPFSARWKITDASSKISYVPTGTSRDLWNIVGS